VDGSGTVLVIAAIALIGATGWAGLLLASGLASRGVAVAAADLGAHAAAGYLADPDAAEPEPWPQAVCAEAAAIVEANGGRLRTCTVSEPDSAEPEHITVTVSAPTALPLHRLGVAEIGARARAEVRYR